MKRTALTAGCVLLLAVAGCSSSGHSKSYKLGQYDGPRLSKTVTNVSPSGVAAACKSQFADYQNAHALGQLLDQQHQAGTSGGPDTASTPDFSIKIPDIARTDYLSGCESALKASLR